MLDRKTAKNLGIYAAYQGLRYVAPIVLTPFLARVLARQQFSELVILNSCVWTSTVFMEFGFYLYGVSKTAAAADYKELSRTVTAITAGKLMLAPVALAAYIALAAWAGLLARNPLVVAIGALSALGYGASFAWFFQGQQRGGTAVLTEAAPQALYYALILFLVRKPGDLWLVVLCQTIPPLVSLGVALKIIGRSGLFGRFDMPALRSVMSEALPYFVERFCFTLYTAVTPTLIGALSVAAEASYYSIGDRVGIFLSTLPGAVFQAVVPFLSRKVRLEGGGWRLSLGLVAGITLVVGAAATITFFAVGVVITHFFSKDFQPAIPIARLFCINAVISVFGMALANFVIIPRNVARVMIYSSSAALVFGLVSQLIMVPRYGALGAVLSRCTSETIVTGILGLVVVRMLVRDLRTREGASVSRIGAD